MPFKLTLQKKVADSVWTGVGTFEGQNHLREVVTGEAELLLKAEGKTLKPILDSSLGASRVMGKEVLAYVDPPSIPVKKVAEGVAFEIGKGFNFSLKK